MYDYTYVSRRNVVHAYDVIQQLDAATKSGNVTLSATDILTLTEWFFRVNKALKIFEGYIPYEFATASAIPTIYANDLSTIYDVGASVNVVKVVSVFDKLITDGISYTKSYSPLFFTLLRRKTPIRYLTLPVSDGFGISDYASVKKIIIVSAGDSVTADSASAKGVVAVLVPDYGLLTDAYDLRNRTIAVYDIIPVIDYSTAVKAKVLEAFDYISAADNVYSNRAVVITALERLVADGTSYTKSYSPLFFTLLRKRVPVVYKTLGVLDMVAVRDGLSVAVIKKAYASDYVVSDYAGIKQVGVGAVDYVISDSAITAQVKKVLASDYIGFDSVSYIKSYSPLFFSILRRKVPIVYKTLSMLDIVAVRDSASVIPIKVVSVSDVVPAADRVDAKNIVISVSDYVVYDSASAAKIEVVSMLDVVAVKDSASVIPIRVVSVFDSMVVSDHATAKMISIPVSDYIMYDSVVPISYVALSVFDRISLPDSVSVVARKVVSASDLIMYDYVPSMSPSSIRYTSLYANVGMRTISVLDRITPYESVWVGPRVVTVNVFDRITQYESVWVGPRGVTVNARDYLVSDGVAIVKRSVHAYDVVVVWENVNIVRL